MTTPTFQGIRKGNRVRHIATGALGTVVEVTHGKTFRNVATGAVTHPDFRIAWDARGGAVFPAVATEVTKVEFP